MRWPLAALVMCLCLGPGQSNRRVRRVSVSKSSSTADESASVFSSDGRILQISYAEEAARRGALCACVVFDGGFLVAVESEARSVLSREDDSDKLQLLGDRTVAVLAGLRPDSRYLCSRAREIGVMHWERYGEEMSASSMATKIAGIAASYDARHGGRGRPLAAALLVVGATEGFVYKVEPSGLAVRGRALAIGRGSKAAQTALDNAVRDGDHGLMSQDEAEDLLRRVFRQFGGGRSKGEPRMRFFAIDAPLAGASSSAGPAGADSGEPRRLVYPREAEAQSAVTVRPL